MKAEQKSILLVEDEPLLALAEKQRLEDKGYRVHHVSTGEKAVVTVLKEPFPIDLVLMDINLGRGIDGTEAAQRILEHKDIPVVFLSSHTEPEVVEKTEKITSYGYVVKNSGVVVLDASIKMALKLFAARMERKEAELEAQKRENFLNKVFEVLPIGLWFADEKGTLRQGNPAGIKIWGAEPKVPIEKYGVFKARRLPSGEELAPEEWALAHTVKERVTIADELLEIEAFDGEKRIILNYTAPVTGDDGTLLGAVIVNNDITEKYGAERDLRESEAHNRESAVLLDTIQQLAHIGGWEWDVEKQSMKWTDEAYRIHGMQPGEIPAGSPLHISRSISCYEPEDRPRIEAAFRRCADEGIPYDLEFPLKRIDGERIWIRTMANALRADDRIAKVVGYIMDITGQKQAEELVQNERRRLAGIIEGTNAGTWEWNTQTGETIFNERWAGIIGYTLEELSPVSIETWQRFTHPGDMARSTALLEKHFRGEIPFYECEHRMKHRDGRWVWVLDRGKVMSRTGDGKPLLVMGTHLDISDQKRTEENHLLLSSAAAQLQTYGPKNMDYNTIIETARSLSGASFGALNLFNRDGSSFTTVALAGVPDKLGKAASLLGFSLVGRNWSHDPDKEAAIEKGRSALFPSLGALTKGVVSGTAVKLIEKTFGLGEVLVVRVSREARDLGDFTLFFTRDSSLQNQMLLEMYAEIVGITLSRIEVEKENLDLLHEKETLLKEVQHRIKNNMNTMTSLLSLQEQAMQDPAAAAVLNDARSRFRSMEVLYDQLYRGESYEGGSVVEYLKALVPQVVDLFPNASGVRVRVHSGSEDKGFSQTCILEASVLSALGLMVNELVTNAMKYAFADRGGTLEVFIDCSDPLVEISVADNGPGFQEPLYPDKPAGFGLTMVRALAEQLEGSVSFTSREKRGGGGTEVIIRFPRGERYEKK